MDMDKNCHYHKESSGPWRIWEAEKWHRDLFHMPGGVLLVKRLGFTKQGLGFLLWTCHSIQALLVYLFSLPRKITPSSLEI